LTDEIDLLTVSFDGELAPDRKSAKAGLKELKRVAPSRRYAIHVYFIYFLLLFKKIYIYIYIFS